MEKIIRFGISVIDFDPEGRRRPVDRSGVHAVRGDRRYVFFCGERSVRKRSERLRTEVSINRFDRRRRLLVRGVTMRIRGLRTVRMQNAWCPSAEGLPLSTYLYFAEAGVSASCGLPYGVAFLPALPDDAARSVGDRFRSKIAGKHECPVQKSRFSGVPEQQDPQGIPENEDHPFGSGLRFGFVGAEGFEPPTLCL